MSQDTVTIQPLEIDYGTDIRPAVGLQEDWETPIRRYFGPKDKVTGKSAKEPPYTFVPYPSMRYAQPDGPGTKIVTKLVNSEAEDKGLGPGWSSTPATFGYVGAPSWEENLRLQNSPAQKMLDEQREREAKIAAMQEKYAAEEKERADAERKAREKVEFDAAVAEAVATALANQNPEKRGPGRPPKQD